jgi:hypothetical protein
MSQNPFQPPQNDDPALPGSTKTVDPETARAIKERIQRLNRNSLLIGGPGLLIQSAAQGTTGPTKAVVLLVGTGLLIYGLSLYAKMRNRNPWWGLLGLFSCLGMLFLLVLPKKCHHCGATTKGKTCDACGAPAPI